MNRGGFYLDKQNRKWMGVCAGIARKTGWDATFVRVALVVVTLAGAFPWTLIAYVAAGLIAKPRPVYLSDEDSAPVRFGRRTSTAEMTGSMRDIDRRLAEVETYVTTNNSSLAREIEALR